MVKVVTKEELEQRVRRGIALLDNTLSEWRDKIDFVELSSVDYEMCIVGQIYSDRSYRNGLAMFDLSSEDAWRYGFDLASDEKPSEEYSTWRMLDATWKRLVKESESE